MLIRRPRLGTLVLTALLAAAPALNACGDSSSTPNTSASTQATSNKASCSRSAAAKATALAAPNEALLSSLGFHVFSAGRAYSAAAHSCYYTAGWSKGPLLVVLHNDRVQDNQIRSLGIPRRWVNVEGGPLSLKLSVAQRLFNTPSVWRAVGANTGSDDGFSRHANLRVATNQGTLTVTAYQATGDTPNS